MKTKTYSEIRLKSGRQIRVRKLIPQELNQPFITIYDIDNDRNVTINTTQIETVAERKPAQRTWSELIQPPKPETLKEEPFDPEKTVTMSTIITQRT